MDKTPGINDGADEAKLEFHYIKSSTFRVIHVDGVHGGVSPKHKLQMAVFSERNPIPQLTVHKVHREGKGLRLDEEIIADRVMRTGVVREVEAELLMDIEVAESLREWLDNQIKAAKSLVGNGR